MFYAVYRRNSFLDLLSPEALAYCQGLGSRKLEAARFCMQRNFYYCTTVNTAKTGSPLFCVYPSFIFVSVVYICIAYWLLPYLVHDSYIQYE